MTRCRAFALVPTAVECHYVVMPTRNGIDQAVRIDRAIDPSFPLDLIVCSPKKLAWRLKEGDSFLREITSKGKVLYEKTDGWLDGVGSCIVGRIFVQLVQFSLCG